MRRNLRQLNLDILIYYAKKHLPVMKVCENPVQLSHNVHSAEDMNGCMDKTIILPPCKLCPFLSVKVC